MYLPLPKRLGKKTKTKKIDGTPLIYTIIDEEVFLAKSSTKKAFCLHKLRHEDGKEEFRIGYYMIAHKPRMRGRWAWGQYAPMMTKEEMAEIFDKLKTKRWI
jgi:hypothetical protein